MVKLAAIKNGKCLSDSYTNCDTKLTWQCEKGHVWQASPDSIKRTSWCPCCVGKNKTINDMQVLAAKRNGKCLSTEYKGVFVKLIWECELKHVWETAPTSVLCGRWCPICGLKTIGDKLRKYTMEDMQEWSKKFGGKCLSTEYLGMHKKLEWECSNGHVWPASPSSVKKGHWCNTCRTYFTESKCRFIVEKLTGLKFPKDRTVLKRLELDMLNKDLKLAIEYNGLQHYKEIGYFHNKGCNFSKQKSKDRAKKKQCKELGIKLITISCRKVSDDNSLVKYIWKKISKLNIPVCDIKDIDLELFYSDNHKLEELRVIAAKKGGECLSNQYINARTPILFRCMFRHEWKAAPRSIKNGSWCNQCFHNRGCKDFNLFYEI